MPKRKRPFSTLPAPTPTADGTYTPYREGVPEAGPRTRLIGQCRDSYLVSCGGEADRASFVRLQSVLCCVHEGGV